MIESFDHAHCIARGCLAHPGGSEVKSRGQIANCNADCVRLCEQKRASDPGQLCVAVVDQASAVRALLLLLLLVSSYHRGKGEQCRVPTYTSLTGLKTRKMLGVSAVSRGMYVGAACHH